MVQYSDEKVWEFAGYFRFLAPDEIDKLGIKGVVGVIVSKYASNHYDSDVPMYRIRGETKATMNHTLPSSTG